MDMRTSVVERLSALPVEGRCPLPELRTSRDRGLTLPAHRSKTSVQSQRGSPAENDSDQYGSDVQARPGVVYIAYFCDVSRVSIQCVLAWLRRLGTAWRVCTSLTKAGEEILRGVPLTSTRIPSVSGRRRPPPHSKDVSDGPCPSWHTRVSGK